MEPASERHETTDKNETSLGDEPITNAIEGSEETIIKSSAMLNIRQIEINTIHDQQMNEVECYPERQEFEDEEILNQNFNNKTQSSFDIDNQDDMNELLNDSIDDCIAHTSKETLIIDASVVQMNESSYVVCYICSNKYTCISQHINICGEFEKYYQLLISPSVFSLMQQQNAVYDAGSVIERVNDIFEKHKIDKGTVHHCLYGFGYENHEKAKQFREKMAHRYKVGSQEGNKKADYQDFLHCVSKETSKIDDETLKATLQELQSFLYIGICREKYKGYDLHGSKCRLIAHVKEAFTYFLLKYVNKKCAVILNCGIEEDLENHLMQSISECPRRDLMFIATCFSQLPENVAKFLELCCIQSICYQLSGNTSLTNLAAFSAVPVEDMREIGAQVLLLLNKSPKEKFNPLTYFFSIYSPRPLTQYEIRPTVNVNNVPELNFEVLSLTQYPDIESMKALFDTNGPLNALLETNKKSKGGSTFAYNEILLFLLHKWGLLPDVLTFHVSLTKTKYSKNDHI